MVAIVTDSSASLPAQLVGSHRVAIVPLHVAIDGTSYDEGVDVTADEVARALRDGGAVTTSRPSPGAFLQVYEELAARGEREIVSVHLSAQMSATLSSAEIAAEQSPARVRVVDSGTVGMAMGYAVLTAVEAAEAGADLSSVAQVAADTAAASRTFVYVDTLEYLRKGGRVGKASAFFGSALAIKPLLQVSGGHIEPLERVRTSTRAMSRLVALTVEAAAACDAGVDLAVQHLAARDRAEQLAERLAGEVDQARRVHLVELGAAVGAHAGPGTIAVSLSPRSPGRRAVVGAGD
ncbi:DegV family protein [Calidifontibacter sp. DB0510]|uniref:DegV family protein n=1 Tax=Metallococcus carri TaxID=1656884 RepID=A0A967B5P7_9MICO|nr:DegV family protein [Metallococcus carri]NHN56082.1 DegV family protein [Metallococcus carri]NOP37461.1 DegV family protein [Calidifontibacter sp. DB2511S]